MQSQTIIHKRITYSVMLGGGITFYVAKQENSHGLTVSIEWANGDELDSLQDFNPRPEDLPRLAELFALIASEVN